MKKNTTQFPCIWEDLDQTTQRRKIYGGWIVWSSVNEVSECMCYVPDPEHNWEIVKPENLET